MLHTLIQTWFQWVHDGGYLIVFALMALESSIVPVPSEVVVPPAAYWAAQGRFSMAGVIVVSMLGSLFGSLVSYGVSRAVGRPLVLRYGKYVLFPPEKVSAAEALFARYGAGGIFFARLLPVVRHLSSIPAGLVRMPVVPFSILTSLGAGVWCGVLAWFGREVIGDEPALLSDPNALVHTLKAKLLWFVGAAVVLLAAYVLVTWLMRRTKVVAPAPSKGL